VYRQLIRSLMYLINRPDSCYAMNVLSQFMSQPRQTHEIAVKHVLRYIRGIVGYVLRYASSMDVSLQGYANTYWVESTVDRKSTSGCCFSLSFTMVCWCNRKQSSMALSIAEAEHIALSVAVREAMWLRKPLTDSFDHEMDSIIITRAV
jgi:hypothetical protein